jgi:two-component system, cell cycle response regulator
LTVDVLVAEDHLVSLRMLESRLECWGYNVVGVSDGDHALELLSKPDGPRLALLDWMMPGFSGPQVCAEVRKLTDLPYRYLIILTSREDSTDVVSGLEHGADDYLTKPWNPSELCARLSVGRRVVDLQSALEEKNQQLLKAVRTDYLTNALNRSALMERLGEETARAIREKKPLGLVMVDLDDFKQVNDGFGHLAGDAALIEAVRCMDHTKRPYDVLGRYGGEEFLLIVPGIPQKNFQEYVERQRHALEHREVVYKGQNIPISGSFGGVWGMPTKDSSTNMLLEAADVQLYRAKTSGRNCYKISTFAP